MCDEQIKAITRLVDRLVTLAERDDGVRDDLRSVAKAVLIATERSSILAAPEPSGQLPDQDATIRPMPELPPPVVEGSGIGTSVPMAVSMPPSLPELTLGRTRPSEAVVLPQLPECTTEAATTDADLPDIEAHCRLKAEGARWAATRRHLIDQEATFGVEIAPRDREILGRARDLGCFLWMNTAGFSVLGETASLEDVAGCFTLVANVVALLRGMLPSIEANREFLDPALVLLAEAQSALRVVVERVGGPRDRDQWRAFDWLRGMAEREQIHIRRHMRLEDPADPASRPEIQSRIGALDAGFREVLERAKRRKSPLNRLRYHAKLIGEGKGVEHDWRKVVGAIEELIGEGVPPSSVEVRQVLLPILDGMPDLDNLPAGFGLAMREIDHYLAVQMSPHEVTPDEETIHEVAEAARLLRGKSVVLIGGSRRPGSCEALKSALGLGELIWIGTREHESIERLEPAVSRPEVALVLVAIRWSSHSFEGVKKYCERNGKPMVRLPGGYSPNQVAAQIIAQCSRRLERVEGHIVDGCHVRAAAKYG